MENDYYCEYNELFTFLGYDNSNIIYLIGFPVILLIIYAALVTIYLLALLIKSKK